jgi:hypothetical protein
MGRHATHLRAVDPDTAHVPTMSEDMSRGEMIRRLDVSCKQVREQLDSGPLTAAERHVLVVSLVRLLSIVADSLQAQEDREAVASVLTDVGRMRREDALR